jgi:hypothetical protein
MAVFYNDVFSATSESFQRECAAAMVVYLRSGAIASARQLAGLVLRCMPFIAYLGVADRFIFQEWGPIHPSNLPEKYTHYSVPEVVDAIESIAKRVLANDPSFAQLGDADLVGEYLDTTNTVEVLARQEADRTDVVTKRFSLTNAYRSLMRARALFVAKMGDYTSLTKHYGNPAFGDDFNTYSTADDFCRFALRKSVFDKMMSLAPPMGSFVDSYLCDNLVVDLAAMRLADCTGPWEEVDVVPAGELDTRYFRFHTVEEAVAHATRDGKHVVWATPAAELRAVDEEQKKQKKQKVSRKRTKVNVVVSAIPDNVDGTHPPVCSLSRDRARHASLSLSLSFCAVIMEAVVEAEPEVPSAVAALIAHAVVAVDNACDAYFATTGSTQGQKAFVLGALLPAAREWVVSVVPFDVICAKLRVAQPPKELDLEYFRWKSVADAMTAMTAAAPPQPPQPSQLQQLQQIQQQQQMQQYMWQLQQQTQQIMQMQQQQKQKQQVPAAAAAAAATLCRGKGHKQKKQERREKRKEMAEERDDDDDDGDADYKAACPKRAKHAHTRQPRLPRAAAPVSFLPPASSSVVVPCASTHVGLPACYWCAEVDADLLPCTKCNVQRAHAGCMGFTRAQVERADFVFACPLCV